MKLSNYSTPKLRGVAVTLTTVFSAIQICAQAIQNQLPKTFDTARGLKISNGKVVSKTNDSIRVMHDGGIATIESHELPAEIALKLGFNVSTNDEFDLPDPLETPKRTYHRAKLVGVDPDGIKIMHLEGSAKINYEELPKNIVNAYGPFDPAMASRYREQQKELQAIAYREALRLKASQNQIASESAEASLVQANAVKQMLTENPTFISPLVSVTLGASSSGGKVNTQTNDGVTSSKTTASIRNISCTVRSQASQPQRLRLQCLLLTRTAFVNGPLNAEVAGETSVELGPSVTKNVQFTAEAFRSEETQKIGTLSTTNATYTIYMSTRSGVKYVGWSVRAIDGKGRVCAVASSMAPYDRFSWQTPIN